MKYTTLLSIAISIFEKVFYTVCKLDPVHLAGYFRNRRLFSPNTAAVHTYLAFSGTENEGFQVRSPGWRVLKTEIHRIRVDERKRRFSNTITSCLGSRLALPHIGFENTMCERRFF